MDERQGEQDADRPPAVVVVRDPLVEVRGLAGEFRIGAGLADEDREEGERRSAGRPRRDQRRQEDRGNRPEGTDADGLLRPEPVEEGREEHRLRLEREREPERGGRPRRPAAQQPVEARQQERRVERVHLAPPRAVEHHRGGEQHRAGGQEGERPGARVPEPDAPVGEQRQQEVAEDRDPLRREQRRRGGEEVRRRREQVQVGRVVEREVVLPGAEVPVGGDEVVPDAVGVDEVVGLVGQERNADRQRGGGQRGGETDLPVSPAAPSRPPARRLRAGGSRRAPAGRPPGRFEGGRAHGSRLTGPVGRSASGAAGRTSALHDSPGPPRANWPVRMRAIRYSGSGARAKQPPGNRAPYSANAKSRFSNPYRCRSSGSDSRSSG